METKQFKAESKRLLDMMINSIYTHKEIFLRELISNASDAIDKLYFKSLTDTSVGMNKSDFAIDLAVDKDKRTLTVSDNGIGMTEDELENNLGTIANSGSFAFKKENDLGDDVDIIGQFGVGFYSTFMVAKEVTVETKAYGSDKAFMWKSNGVDGYTVEPCEKQTVGTTITLYLKEDTDDEKYSRFIDPMQIQSLVKKYSDYIRFPIRMEMEHTHYHDDKEEPEVHKAIETLNSMTPIWKKNKNEL
ncbi:MAG: ATP-binding protein, partial [Ruminococcus sp.]|nr:ATP-binding protein [Ruminococcus sp.]